MLQEAVLPAREDARQNALGLIACTALVVGNMIGSGIFLLPASLAACGPISLAGWVLTSVGALVLAVIFGRPVAPGDEDGRSLCLYRSRLSASSPASSSPGAIGSHCGPETPALRSRWPATWLFVPSRRGIAALSLAVALAAIWLVTLVNVRGVAEAGFVQIVTTVLKLVPLVLIGAIGLLWIDPANYTPVNTGGTSNLSAVSAGRTHAVGLSRPGIRDGAGRRGGRAGEDNSAGHDHRRPHRRSSLHRRDDGRDRRRSLGRPRQVVRTACRCLQDDVGTAAAERWWHSAR